MTTRRRPSTPKPPATAEPPAVDPPAPVDEPAPEAAPEPPERVSPTPIFDELCRELSLPASFYTAAPVISEPP